MSGFPSFTMTAQFDAGWKDAGLDDSDLRDLQLALARDPEIGSVMSETGGLRKLRFARPGSGKSGGVRVCYASFMNHGIIALVFVFQKNERAILTRTERQAAADLIQTIERKIAQRIQTGGQA